MTVAQLKFNKLAGDRFEVAFKTDAGSVVCKVSVRSSDRSGRQSANEKRQDALHKAKMLARAFHEAIVVG